MAALRKLAKTCEFGELRDSLVRDRFICGLASVVVKEKLLAISGITLEQAIDKSRAAGLVKEQIKVIEQSDEDRVAAVQKSRSRQVSRSKMEFGGSSDPSLGKKCSRCGYPPHGDRRCPAMGKTCHRCKGVGHFSSMCRSRTTRAAQVQPVAVATTDDSELENEIVYS